MYGFIYFRFPCLLLHGRQSNCALGTACKVPFRRWQSAVSSPAKCRFVARKVPFRRPRKYGSSILSFFIFHLSLFIFHFIIILPSYHRSLKPRCTKGWGMVGCPSPSSHHPPIFAPHPPTILRCMGGSWEDDRLHPPMLNRPVHRHSSHLWYDGRMIFAQKCDKEAGRKILLDYRWFVTFDNYLRKKKEQIIIKIDENWKFFAFYLIFFYYLCNDFQRHSLDDET